MELLIVLTPLIVALAIWVWGRRAPSSLVVAGVLLGAACAAGTLLQSPWPLPLRVGPEASSLSPGLELDRWELRLDPNRQGWIDAARLPGADHDGDGRVARDELAAHMSRRAPAWLGAGQPWIGALLLLDPLSLVLALVASLVGGLVLLEGVRWRVPGLARAVLAQGLALGAICSGDFVIATALLVGGGLAARSLHGQRSPGEGWLASGALALGAAFALATSLGGSDWSLLSASSLGAEAELALGAWLVALVANLALPTPAGPDEPQPASLGAALRLGPLLLALGALIARAAPPLLGAPLGATAVGWLALLVAAPPAWSALRDPELLRGVEAAGGALAGCVLAGAAWGAPSAAVVLCVSGAAALAGLALASGELVSARGSSLRADLGGLRRERPGAMLTVWVGVAVLGALPPFGVYRALGAFCAALWPRGPLGAGALLGAGAVLGLLSWAAWRWLLDLLAAAPSRVVPGAPRPLGDGAVGLGLMGLAALGGALTSGCLEGWQPAAVSARLVGGQSALFSAGWLPLDPGALARPACLVLALLPGLGGVALALWGDVDVGPFEASAPPSEPALVGLGRSLTAFDGSLERGGERVARWALAWWKPPPLPHPAPDLAPGPFGYQTRAYRDAALVVIVLLFGVLLAVLAS